jgi:hypothetical protein
MKLNLVQSDMQNDMVIGDIRSASSDFLLLDMQTFEVAPVPGQGTEPGGGAFTIIPLLISAAKKC